VPREPIVQKLVDGNAVYYKVHWSRLEQADRHRIIATVPAVAGVFELYTQDEHRNLQLLMVSKAWYGGLRAAIRRQTDPELEVDAARRRILEDHPCLYRYSIIQSRGDMDDLLYFFMEIHRPGSGSMHHSGRYEQIFVEEVSKDKIVTI